jgi:flagellin
MSDATADQAQRSANDLEFQNILSSIDRIAIQTQYAGNKLLNGDFTGKVLQIGAFNSQNVVMSISSLSSGDVLGAAGLSVLQMSSASAALSAIETGITAVSTVRGKLGALQANGLEASLNSLRTSYENLRAAESVIRDVDFAGESANFTRNSILVQSATAMLAQANQMPQNVLKLLG